MERPLSEEHPLAALALGVFVVAMSWVWLRYAEAYSRWMFRAIGATYPRIAERRWYRVVHVYFGAAFLLFVGGATIVGSAVELAR